MWYMSWHPTTASLLALSKAVVIRRLIANITSPNHCSCRRILMLPWGCCSKLNTIFKKQSSSRTDLQVWTTNSWLHAANGFSSVQLMYRTNINKVFTFNLYCKHEIKSNYSMQEIIVWLDSLKKKILFVWVFYRFFWTTLPLFIYTAFLENNCFIRLCSTLRFIFYWCK